MRELTNHEVNAVSGAGIVSDATGWVGGKIGDFIGGSIGSLVTIPVLSTVISNATSFIGKTIGNCIGSKVGSVVEGAFSLISGLFTGGGADDSTVA